MPLNANETAALDQLTSRIGYFLRLDVDPPLCLWTGTRQCQPGPDALDPVIGQTYNGFGRFANLPPMQQLINGAGERVDFVLSGVSKRIAGLAAIEDSGQVKNAGCAAGFCVFDADWQPLGPVHWSFQGVADYLGIAFNGASGPKSQSTYAIKLSVSNGFTDRKRRGFQYWTYVDQMARSAGDLFCQFVSKLSLVAQKVWPRF